MLVYRVLVLDIHVLRDEAVQNTPRYTNNLQTEENDKEYHSVNTTLVGELWGVIPLLC